MEAGIVTDSISMTTNFLLHVFRWNCNQLLFVLHNVHDELLSFKFLLRLWDLDLKKYFKLDNKKKIAHHSKNKILTIVIFFLYLHYINKFHSSS